VIDFGNLLIHRKAKLQVQYDSLTKLYNGPIHCAKKIWRANGIQGLYQGYC
jgi:solute carrier family 25 carnitine/acylcarnitine transporter 20/29